VLDLEALAAHRGSVLGDLPDQTQPSQKEFDSRVWHALHGFDPARPVFVERESRRIGRLQLPDAVLEAWQQRSRAIQIELGLAERVALLTEEYAFFTRDVAALNERLQALTELRGKATVARWQSLAEAGDWPTLVAELMQQHYDPLYDRATRAFTETASVETLMLDDAQPATLAHAARQLVG
jgi:tRNA 2-selenouridine synthase